MQKIPSLFKRDYSGTRLVYDEVVEGSEWVLAGEGIATIKIDGTSCLVRDGKLYKRYDRKVSKAAKNKKTEFVISDFKPAPPGWIAAEDEPNIHTGHWPGWLPVGDGNEDQWHREAWERQPNILPDGTYELIGPKIEGNPYKELFHRLVRHGFYQIDVPRNYDDIKAYLEHAMIEGIVWHHPDGRMVKIKSKDFGIDWTKA